MRNVEIKYEKLLAMAVGILYFISNPKPSTHYDYTYRIAERLLGGSAGLSSQPPTWLNEFVPFEGAWYSVFPFGAVVTMVPMAILKSAGIISEMPSAYLAAFIAVAVWFLLLKIGKRYDELPRERLILTACGLLFGTWMWTNLTMGGAWQLALGFAMVGELGAIYFTAYDRRPLVAGAFFALAFGNRSEVLLTAPILMYLHTRGPIAPAGDGPRSPADDRGRSFARLAAFCAVPLALGVSTLLYNQVRFHSFTDFGYARIPGVLHEPWYEHGIFSYLYISRQAWEMLWRPWEFRDAFPYVTPNPFSSSILWSSPFLLFLLRTGARDRVLKYCAWAAIAAMTILLWMHGNSGGWQFGYRYWMVCLPWAFVVLMESSPKKISPLEWAAYIFSFIANLYATWLFHWTGYLRP